MPMKKYWLSGAFSGALVSKSGTHSFSNLDFVCDGNV